MTKDEKINIILLWCWNNIPTEIASKLLNIDQKDLPKLVSNSMRNGVK